MGARSLWRQAVPGICLALAGAICLWRYGQQVMTHITATSGDTLWRGLVAWLGLGIAAAALVPAGSKTYRRWGVVLILVSAMFIGLTVALRMWAEFSEPIGAFIWAFTGGWPLELIYLVMGVLLGYGIKLVSARA
ncbi:hypothetical protein AAK684_05810 [Leptogranulimonas caecicola]|uniref:DUF3995 domain-containing protein n=1 Tax=Leptogranulimonas caecicola TaxID=2894156 RepID=A0AAU9CID1_9ACTN|nr:hypothetical protein [Leptogranulimonas caecicola]BCV19505.1 hypothetical protein ATOBIA_N00400 [Atopobiaceae bacterium P1]BDC90168.1 hypothetical protein ATTO_00400 [Leptogranulimonas caecicola]